MAKEGFPFVIVPALLAMLLATLGLWALAAAFVLLTAFMGYFFRDPARRVPDRDDVVVSPADGKITRVEDGENEKIISIFLSPLDVHVNRAPIAGEVTEVKYVKGKKMPATSNTASFENERNSLFIKGAKISVVCTQIAGIVARRIVCRAAQGDTLQLGQRFGLIKFSSRTDLILPGNVALRVKLGDRVVGGETIIAEILN